MGIPAKEPKVLILDKVKKKWVDTNITGVLTPDFHTGWWNPKSIGPQVTFNSVDELYQGDSGYGAIGAAGPVQVSDGLLNVNCWAVRGEGVFGSTNPKKLVYEMAEEVRRIVLANLFDIPDIEYLSITSIIDVPPAAGENPVGFRKSIMLKYQWRTT